MAATTLLTSDQFLALPEEFDQHGNRIEIAIEVVSSTGTARHLKRKIDAYLDGGAKSVWVVFPEARSVVYRANQRQSLKEHDPITDPLLPGFSSPVAAFFELT